MSWEKMSWEECPGKIFLGLPRKNKKDIVKERTAEGATEPIVEAVSEAGAGSSRLSINQ
jgi:hypothetical protein